MTYCIRWGIVSSGQISSDFVNAVSSTLNPDEHKVVAVSARKLDCAKSFAEKFGIKHAFEGHEAMADCSDVDVIYVGAINTSHQPIVKTLLSAGKHVLCEKPLGMNVKETKEMVALAREKQVFFMEAIWSRFLPSYVKLREELEKETIGDVKLLDVTFGQVIESDRVRKIELGGGSMLDIGIYCIHAATHVFGAVRPEKIVHHGVLNKEGTDTSVSGTYTYPGGKVARFLTHTELKLPCSATVYGTKGRMTLGYPFWCADELKIEVLNAEPRLHMFPYKESAISYNYMNSAGLAFEAEHVRQCLEKGLTESPDLPHSETLLIATLMEEGRKAVGVSYPQD